VNLDLGTVLLQWATGGLLLFWWTARRSVVGVGYGWLLRGVYGALGAIGLALEIRSDHTGAGHVVAIVGGAGLVVATLVAFAISWARRARDDRGPLLLDVVAPALGLVGLLGLAGVTGGAYWLATVRLLSGAVFLGSITDAMLLGHWYLVQPGLARAPLEELVHICLFVWPLEIIVLLLPPGMVGIVAGNTDDGYGGLLGWMWVVSAITTVGLLWVTRLALRERYYSAVMAATGLLYLAILTAFGTDVVARALLTP
jgi:hypothetical protein